MFVNGKRIVLTSYHCVSASILRTNTISVTVTVFFKEKLCMLLHITVLIVNILEI